MQNLSRKLFIVHQLTGDYRSCCKAISMQCNQCSSAVAGLLDGIYPATMAEEYIPPSSTSSNTIMHQSWCYSKYLLLFKIRITNKITSFQFNDWDLLGFTCSKSSQIKSKNKEQEFLIDSKKVSDEDSDTFEDFVTNKFHKIIIINCPLPSHSTQASRLSPCPCCKTQLPP